MASLPRGCGLWIDYYTPTRGFGVVGLVECTKCLEELRITHGSHLVLHNRLALFSVTHISREEHLQNSRARNDRI